MTWIDFGKLSLFVSRRADAALRRWAAAIDLRGGGADGASAVVCQLNHLREIVQVQSILCAPAPVPILDRAFLIGYYGFGHGPQELSSITGVPVEDTHAVMERAVRTFAQSLAAADVQRASGSIADLDPLFRVEPA